MREYGIDRLADGARLAAAREAHATYFADLAQDADSMIRSPEQLTAIQLLAAESDNLSAAMLCRGSIFEHKGNCRRDRSGESHPPDSGCHLPKTAPSPNSPGQKAPIVELDFRLPLKGRSEKISFASLGYWPGIELDSCHTTETMFEIVNLADISTFNDFLPPTGSQSSQLAKHSMV